MDDAAFVEILNYFNLSWEGYRKVRKGVKKRLTKHMQQLGCSRVDDYLAVLSRRPAHKNECRRLLTVSISRFFRDRSLWETLQEKILPGLIAESAAPFRVWSCGCARGEEVYSFRIVWNNLQQAHSDLPELSVRGTDMNPEYLAMARQGTYERSSLKELSADQIERYFDKVPGKQRYIVKSFLRRAVRFDQADILHDPPPGVSFAVVFIRNNLLTYHRSADKERGLQKIVRSLTPGGALITGSHEKIPENFSHLQAYEGHPWIFFNRS